MREGRPDFGRRGARYARSARVVLLVRNPALLGLFLPCLESVPAATAYPAGWRPLRLQPTATTPTYLQPQAEFSRPPLLQVSGIIRALDMSRIPAFSFLETTDLKEEILVGKSKKSYSYIGFRGIPMSLRELKTQVDTRTPAFRWLGMGEKPKHKMMSQLLSPQQVKTTEQANIDINRSKLDSTIRKKTKLAQGGGYLD